MTGEPPRPVRVYFDGRGIDVPADATALDALRLADADAAEQVAGGARALVDSRGLPAAPDAPVHGGAIFRVVRARPGAPPDGADQPTT